MRFYQLGNIPNSLNWDEVSWGYSAYSILQTGKDEHGNILPLSFKAFGDYKQPLYIYASVPGIALFGFNEFSTRLPSAFFGTLTILFVYLFTFELFRKEKYAKTVALFSMLFFAISPWSIQFSRVAYEANVGLFFIILGSWLFIKGLNAKRNKYLFMGAIALALSAYTYHSDKLFAPALFIVLILYGWKYFFSKKVLIISLLVVFALSNIFWVVDSRTTARGRGVLFTGSQTQLLQKPLQQMNYDQVNGDPIRTIVHNRRVVYLQQYITNYLEHFNPVWLFMKGDNPRHHTPGMGILYVTNIAFILLGIFYLTKYKFRTAWILFVWLLLAPGASALATDAPNASRSLIFLPTWHIFEAFGWWYAFSSLKNVRTRMILLLPLLFLIFNVIYYLHQYFVHTNTEVQKDWQYGYKEAIQYTSNTDHNIIFTNNFEQPYIFYLFYTQYDPNKYIQEGGLRQITKNCYAISNSYFGECRNQLKTGDLFVTLGEEAFKGKKVKQFNYADGNPATTIYEYE